jgi:AraC-like DNA-binding protein
MMRLDQLLDGLDVGVSAFAICELRRDAAFVLEETTNAAVHYVLSGEGVVWRMTGQADVLAPHTVIIVPPGTCVTIAHNPERRLNLCQPNCEPLPEGWDRLTVGESEAGLTLACGFVRAMYLQMTGLFDYLREPLVVSVADDTTFREPFHQLLGEVATPKPGTRVLAEMLMKQCLIALLRRQSDAAGECHAPWLAALWNPALGRAISAILDRPDAGHTLESLGDVAGMSRAAFAERFKEAFDRTPMDFLKEVRLRRAARLLGETELPVKTVAYRVGFSSRSYFSRAFKEFYGIDPAGFRTAPVGAPGEPALHDEAVAALGLATPSPGAIH